jgi:hypothetical protein
MKKIMLYINLDRFLLTHKNTRAGDVIMSHVMSGEARLENRGKR